MKRKRLALAVVVLAVLVATAAWVMWPQRSRVTKENYARITAGMTRRDVETVLGGPPGDYRSGPTERASLPLDIEMLVENDALNVSDLFDDEWEGDTAAVMVHFRPDGRVGWKAHRINERAEQSATENFLWRVQRQWQKWFSKRQAP
jgi:hypothetical protein